MPREGNFESHIVLCGLGVDCTPSENEVKNVWWHFKKKNKRGRNLKKICTGHFFVAGAGRETSSAEMFGAQGAHFLRGTLFDVKDRWKRNLTDEKYVDRYIAKQQVSKTVGLGALLDVELLKKVHGVLARSTLGSKKC